MNLTYLIAFLSHFKKQVIKPLAESLIINLKKDFVKYVRNKLIIFLVKSKFLIKLIKNSENLRDDDIFTFKNEEKFKKLLKHIKVYEIGTKEDCEKNYEKLGRKMQRFFYAVVKAQKKEINYPLHLAMIENPNFYEMAIDLKKIEEMSKKIGSEKNKKLITPLTVVKFVGNIFDKNVQEMAELHNCFPEPDFLYFYYNLIDSKWNHLSLQIFSKLVKHVKKIYIPVELFKGEFVKNDLYPQTKIRLLSNHSQWNQLTPVFLTQESFLNKKKMQRASSEKYLEQFRFAIQFYRYFDIKESKSRKSTFIIKRKFR